MSITGEGEHSKWTARTPRLHWPAMLRSLPTKKAGAIALLAIMGALLFGFGLLQTSLFAVTRIDVIGAGHVTKAQTLSLSGIKVGDAMFSVNGTKAVTHLKTSPWIEQARVKLSWPHVVAIYLVERKAVAVAQTVNNEWAQIGADGVVLAVAPAPQPGLPVILNFKAPDQAGGVLDATSVDLVHIAELMPPSLVPHVKQMQNQAGTLRLGLDTGTIVVLGDNTDLANKLMSAASVVSHTDATKLAILDVRSPHLPVATPTPGQAPVNEGTTTTTTTPNKNTTTTVKTAG